MATYDLSPEEYEKKDEALVEIGETIADRVGDFQGAVQSTALVPAVAGGPVAPAGDIEAQAMNPFESMMAVLADIRDGIYNLVDKFSEGVSLEQKQLDAQDEMADQAAMASDMAAFDDPIPDAPEEQKGGGMMAAFKDKTKKIGMSLKDLLIKGGLIGGLLLFFEGIQKYGDEIAKFLAPVWEGVKWLWNWAKNFATETIFPLLGKAFDKVKEWITEFAAYFMENIWPGIVLAFTKIKDFVVKFWSFFKDDVFVLFEDMWGLIKDAFGSVVKLIKGIFSGDGDMIRDAVSDILTLPVKFLSMIGKFVMGMVDAVFRAFGIDPPPAWVQKLYDFFDRLPEIAKEFFHSVITFITKTLPEKIVAAKDAVVGWFTSAVDGVTGFFKSIKDFFTETIPNKVKEIGDNISQKFTEIKDEIVDFAMAPFRKIRELLQNLLVGILESVENLPFIGDKAREMKEALTGERSINKEDQAQMDALGSSINKETGQIDVQTNDAGYVMNPQTGEPLEVNDEENARMIAGQLSANSPGEYEASLEGIYGFRTYKIRRKNLVGDGSNVSGVGATTSGATLNSDSAELNSSSGGGGGTVISGGDTYTNNSSVSQTRYSEDTGADDRNWNASISMP